MAEKKTSVFGIYATRSDAECAADALIKGGFTTSDISVLLPENLGGRAIGTGAATDGRAFRRFGGFFRANGAATEIFRKQHGNIRGGEAALDKSVGGAFRVTACGVDSKN